MALKIKDEEILGTIDKLEDKLDGKLPVDRLELLYLVNSWGRIDFFYTQYLDEDVKIEQCKATQSEQALLVRKECYDLSKLDVSQITNMNGIFSFSEFKDDIGNWNVSNVTNMNSMFSNAINFNQPLNSWNTSNVISMRSMFCNAKSFNHDISQWNTSNVTSMDSMFNGATKFNSDIGNWDVSKVINMHSIFFNAENFNANVSSWCVSNVTDMSYMFSNAKKFNQNISKWNLDGVKRCFDMFDDAEDFELKYNNGKELPSLSDNIKDWLNDNRDRMNMIDVKDKYGKEIDDFFSNFSNKEFSKEI